MAEPGPAQHLAILHLPGKRLFERGQYTLAPPFAIHAHEAHQDRAGEIAQPNLPRHVVGRFEIGVQRRFGVAAIDIDGYAQRRGLDHQRAAAHQAEAGAQRLLHRFADAGIFIELAGGEGETFDQLLPPGHQPMTQLGIGGAVVDTDMIGRIVEPGRHQRSGHGRWRV